MSAEVINLADFDHARPESSVEELPAKKVYSFKPFEWNDGMSAMIDTLVDRVFHDLRGLNIVGANATQHPGSGQSFNTPWQVYIPKGWALHNRKKAYDVVVIVNSVVWHQAMEQGHDKAAAILCRALSTVGHSSGGGAKLVNYTIDTPRTLRVLGPGEDHGEILQAIADWGGLDNEVNALREAISRVKNELANRGENVDPE